METIFKIIWDDQLGKDWMNQGNLELCLFSKACVGGKAKDAVKVRALVEKNLGFEEG